MIIAFKEFIRCKRGNIAIMTAGLALPMFTIIAGGLDYADLVKARDNIQHASDAAVLAAFKSAPHGWKAMQQDAQGYFKANIAKRSQFGPIKTKLTRKIIHDNYVMSYSVKTSVNSLFGDFNPLGDGSITITSTAAYNFKTRRSPRLVPNDFDGRDHRKGHTENR